MTVQVGQEYRHKFIKDKLRIVYIDCMLDEVHYDYYQSNNKINRGCKHSGTENFSIALKRGGWIISEEEEIL